MAENLHTTNYFNTFIIIADDSKAAKGEVPQSKGDRKTVAEMQFDILVKHPYQFTSDDVLFNVYAERNDISTSERENARTIFFSKGQPCFRASPLTKKFGFGVHANHEGKIAIYGIESDEYEAFSTDNEIKMVKAMRSSR